MPGMNRWHSLSPLERYLNLFATWTLVANGEMVGDSPLAAIDGLDRVWSARPTRCFVSASRAAVWGPYGRDIHLLGMFGMMDVESGPQPPGKSWWPRRLHQTDFGERCCGA